MVEPTATRCAQRSARRPTPPHMDATPEPCDHWPQLLHNLHTTALHRTRPAAHQAAQLLPALPLSLLQGRLRSHRATTPKEDLCLAGTIVRHSHSVAPRHVLLPSNGLRGMLQMKSA